LIRLSLLLFSFGASIALAQQQPTLPATPAMDSSAAEPQVSRMLFSSAMVNKAEWRPLTGEERWRIYWRRTYFTPGVIFRTFGPATGSHLSDEPPQWGQGAEGYFRRAGNRFARFTMRDTMEAAGAAAIGHDVRYIKCDCTGFFPRFGHALAMGFVTLDRNGKYAPAYARYGAAFGAEFIGNTWMPSGYRDKSEAFRGVGIQIAYGSLFNVVREFMPARKK